MEEKGKILIITDNSSVIRQFAEKMIEFFDNSPLSGSFSISEMNSEVFSGKDLLPVSAFFIGCETPQAFTSPYFNDFFKHVNLAGRACGIFSPDKKAIAYMKRLLKESEAALGNPFLCENNITKKNLLNWMKEIIKMAAKK